MTYVEPEVVDYGTLLELTEQAFENLFPASKSSGDNGTTTGNTTPPTTPG